MELLNDLWSTSGTRALLIVIGLETLLITATIIWLIFQNRHDEHLRESESEFSDKLTDDFLVALNSASQDALDDWHRRAQRYPDELVRDFLQHSILRAGGAEREKLVDHYRRWDYIEHDRQLLNSSSPRKRLFALRRLHSVARPEDRDLVYDRVEDNYLERLLAAQILARIGSAEDILELLGDVSIRSQLMEEPFYAIVEQMDLDKLARLFEQRDAFEEPRFRRILLEVAAERGLDQARDAAISAAKSDLVEERIGACNAAAFLDRQAGRKLLLELVDDEDWRVRARSTKVLRRFPDPAVFDALEDAITDQAFWVRQNAANSLRWMGDEGIEHLQRIRAQDDDAFAADAADQELQRYKRLSTSDQRQLSIGPRGIA
ncbi:MAG: HEAT repeat domain-containing protein [Myxococcota bacterium]